MIKNKSRKFWFGASDTKFVMSNWDTKTFMDWWQTKLGIRDVQLYTVPVICGTNKEYQISNHYSETHNAKITKDRQIKIRKLRLRVNLDCETKDKIVEIKTHKQTDGEWKLPKEYVWQVQVQMFGTKKHKACIYAYGLLDEDYDNFYLPIDEARITEHEIEYDKEWIENEYLPRLKYLSWCIKSKKTPNKNDFKEIQNV